MRRKDALLARALRPSTGSTRSARFATFDAVYTAPHFGFASAADYYHRASGDARHRSHPRSRRSIITAEDDPFVPVDAFRDPALAGNPQHQLIVTRTRRPLRISRPVAGDGRRRLLGGDGRIVEFASQPRFAAAAFEPSVRLEAFHQRRANSGPFPSSSCLK